MRTFLLVLVVGAGVVSLSIGGCGGSSGGDPAPLPADATLFSGTYFWLLNAASDESPATDEATGQWGTAVADGAGSMTVSATENDNGSIGAPTVTTVSYTVASDRTWAWQALGMDVMRGGIASDGRILGGASVLTGVDPAITLLVRREGAYGNASLSGVYHVCSLRLFPTSGDMMAWWGTATFDGAGGVTFSYSQNLEGGIGGPGIGGATSYSVLADGTMTIAAPPATGFEGGVVFGGDLAVVGGSTVAAEPPGLMLFIRQSTAASPALAVGDYFLAGLSRSGGGFESITGPATMDGVGTVNVTFTRNSDGAIGLDPPATAFFAVMPNGALSVTPSGGTETFEGAITPDGRFAMIAGEASGSSGPQLVFLFR